MFETGAERGRTCLNRHLPYASINCQAGCACAPGLVDDGVACVAPEQCPCYYQNHRYSPNSQVTRDCNTCVCQGGYWQCTDYLCNAECSLIGQSHLITFDDLQVEFDGDCRYVLATNEERGFQTRHSLLVDINFNLKTIISACKIISIMMTSHFELSMCHILVTEATMFVTDPSF